MGPGGGTVTPNLVGRWQTRLYLLGLIGGIIALGFVWRYNASIPYSHRDRWIPLFVLAYLLLFGFVWDMIYQVIVHRRWDYDWPGAYVLIAGIIEGAVVFLLIRFVGLPLIPKGSVDFGHFILEYGVIWTFTYFWVQFLMRAIFIRWRFRAARFG
jgi:uncharacterized membrane protein